MNVRTPLESLRSATRERHRALEAMPSQQRLLQSDYRLAEYRSLLQRLYGFYMPLASALDNRSAWSVRVTDRAELLAHDLRDLGSTAADLRELARCEDLPMLDTCDRVLGCRYVMEGATLGGRVIVKHLERTFREFGGTPMRFFAGDGTVTAKRWLESCAIVNAEATDFDQLCATACATFDAMAAWLESSASTGDVPA
ncbi:MAG: biliverdin-producing heme oxygenase [Candidatus Eremiobacteraeota bacterium]|nr:biliverdin-producing heme oxygenase [Candidatus Eremiobacteraeota bacterium]